MSSVICFYKAYREGDKEIAKKIRVFCGLEESPSHHFMDLFFMELKNMLHSKYSLTDQQLNALFPGKGTIEQKTDRLLMALADRKNKITFMGDDVESIDPRKLYVTSRGFFMTSTTLSRT